MLSRSVWPSLNFVEASTRSGAQLLSLFFTRMRASSVSLAGRNRQTVMPTTALRIEADDTSSFGSAGVVRLYRLVFGAGAVFVAAGRKFGGQNRREVSS
ncbi:MAG: hypothetical protein JMDDDDMK_04747 [Acidobacteria bacterium]|nr:hypothetical protein [Acidobacteriota bacterium]